MDRKRSSRPRFLDALPPYPGGKRRLLPAILGLIREVAPNAEWPQLTFADPFLGGGSVSLTAKALGFGQVLCNDLALRSVLVGRGLIANSSTRLTETDVLQLYAAKSSTGERQPRLLELLPARLSSLMQRAWSEAAGFEPPKDALAILLLVRCLLSYFPLGLPGATDAHRIPLSDFDPVTGKRLRQYLRRAEALTRPDELIRLARKVNAGVLPGKGRVSQGDALEFLTAIRADVCYVDPPYGKTQSYEGAFRLLDELLGEEARAVSQFSSSRAPLDDLLDACRHIPIVVMSLGSGALNQADAERLVSRHRKVKRFVSIPYVHYGAVAGYEKRLSNKEFLILSTNDGGTS